MSINGEPDSELIELLGEIDDVQQAARNSTRSGATGSAIYAAAQSLIEGSPNSKHLDFVAHGLGLVPNESPRLTYTREDMDQPLTAGMVLSIETTLEHPRRGFIKLEDTVVVATDGFEAFGDTGRGWNVSGRAN